MSTERRKASEITPWPFGPDKPMCPRVTSGELAEANCHACKHWPEWAAIESGTGQTWCYLYAELHPKTGWPK